ncbi:hypothetical protein ACOMHN_058271 [Nucella lapillus]
MYFNDQFNKGGAPIMSGDHMAMRRGEDFPFNNQMENFGPGREGPFPGGGNFNNNFEDFHGRGIFGERPQPVGAFNRQESGILAYVESGLGQPQLGGRIEDEYFHQSALPHAGGMGGYGHAGPGYGFVPESDFERRDSFKDLDRERERDRNRRGQERDRPRSGRRDDSWERGARRDRGDREWSSADRERRRERRGSRERATRDRSPRDDNNPDHMSDDSRMDISEDEGRDSPGRDRYREDRSRQGSEGSRDRDRDRYRDRERDRDRPRNRDDRDRERDRDRGDREGERWMTDEPSATILLRGLSNTLMENDVIQELIRIGMPPKDVRFMRRVSGASRGFGFVEFQTQSEAQRWMDLNQRQVMISEHRLSMHYSAPRVSRDSRDPANKMDWICKCGAHNFKRRDFCYKCTINRRFAEDPLCGVTELDPATHVGKNPCNTLLFRDLDALTTEQGVLQAIANLTSLAIKNTQVIRDDLGTSLCFAFLELSAVATAKQLHDFLQVHNPPLAVDGKQVMVSYAKNTYNTSLDIIMKAQQKLAQNQYYLNYNNYYNQSQSQDANSQYYNYYYGSQQTTATATTTTTAPGNSTNAAAAVAQTAIMQAQAAKAAVATSTQAESQETSQYPVYPPPDVSTYQYDKTSGYYYDPSTGLYYEPNTQYYYNSKTSQWMYWDAEKSTYLPAPTQTPDTTPQTAAGTEVAGQATAEKTDKEEKKEKEKTKVAKKIAKDMEKWAKAMNAQKDAMKDEHRKSTNTSGRKESAAADAGFAILQKSKEDMKLMPPPPMTLNPAPEVVAAAVPAPSASGLVASYGGDSDDSGDEDEGVVDESKLADWTKLACLLCKRQFQSREILTKHNQFSELHKKNLENLKVKSAGKVEKKEYRDRAKERRQKYGTPAPPEPRKQAGNDEPVVYEQPTKAGIGTENIGNKMLQKMGWTAGLGLGKTNQGRTAPVETQRRAATAGLGAKGADILAEEGATYKENVKKTLFARYNETE